MLNSSSTQNADLNVANEASRLLCHVTSTHFLLGKVNALSEELQNPKINYLTASSHSSDWVWFVVYSNERVLEYCFKQIIEVTLYDAAPTTHSRRRLVMSKKLTDFFVLSTTGKKDVGRDQTEEYALRANVFFTCIDKLNERFSKNISIFETTSSSFLAPECASNILQLYPTSGIDPIVIDSQLRLL